MASYVMSLPSLIMTSSSIDTSTQTIPAVDISDAICLSGFVNGVTTAPGYQIQVAYTSDVAATFIPLTQIYPVSTAPGNGTGGSTGAIPIYVSSLAFTIPDVAAKQARLASSGVTSTGVTLVWCKRVEV